MSKGIVWRSLDSIRYYLSPQDKRKSIAMLFWLILVSVLDVFGLASLVPIIMAASRPGSILKNKYTHWLYEMLNFTSEKYFLLFLMVGIFLFFIVKNVFSTLINYQQVKFSARLAVQVVSSQFQKHINLPYLKFNDVGSPNFMNSTLNISNSYVAGVIRQLFILFSEIIIVFLVISGMLVYQPVLFFILGAILVPSMMLIYRLLRNRVNVVGMKLNELRPLSYSPIIESFIGFVELRLAGKQQQFKQYLIDNQEAIQELEADSYLYSLIPQRLIEMVAISAIVLIFLYSLLFANNAAEMVTIIGLFAAAAYRLMPSMNRILTSVVSLRQSQYVLNDLMQMREYLTTAKPAQVPLKFEHNITFDNLSFTFPGSEEPVVRDISLRIKRGEKVGFIGTSGSGKTTLMNLLLRSYTEQKGAITVDGVPLTPENEDAWFKLVGYVKQDTFLMEASIGENITLRDKQVDPERMKYALEQASLADFVASLPEGLDTPIGERGSRLSGGQRQRVGIARALYKRAEVLLLDEATSALDNETEREVSEAINKLSHTSITIFIIAHRLTTLQDCDRIFELKDGRIWAEHTYESLMQQHA
ncbi:ABC transporter ATP-binding protein [Hymenobacter cheonanensis]|uniref:ABC transporter ATP-binding protein n=1 Tax=Hymenobacter sp. CA2-7 TaxID=3063993 RepID=UPI002713BABB|nr:ABC transporter ATP-binding protein [Hymenobacter sp. CA2-7]MDO7884399.1 ABC transporter ATP-binding protein [Hymenobacter sp. CA2-7]